MLLPTSTAVGGIDILWIPENEKAPCSITLNFESSQKVTFSSCRQSKDKKLILVTVAGIEMLLIPLELKAANPMTCNSESGAKFTVWRSSHAKARSQISVTCDGIEMLLIEES